ncbi:MAG: hypothetical protein R3B54_16830 [Bdellovibrionota bacterium]
MKHLILASLLFGLVQSALGNADVLADENILDLDSQISEPLRQQQQDSKIELPEE